MTYRTHFHKIKRDKLTKRRLLLGIASIWNGMVILATLGRYDTNWHIEILREIIWESLGIKRND